MLDARSLLGTHDVYFITLDTLRYDVAVRSFAEGQTPHIAEMIDASGWEHRHSPASFTYAAHHAFFAGFLPTPIGPGPHPRLFGLSFEGSETINERTLVFDAPDIVRGFSDAGYHTVCIGGVGFFNKLNPLGRVLPSLFAESHWERALSVTDPNSTEHQVELACRILGERDDRVFLFVNVSAIHQPTTFYLEGAVEESIDTHAAALRYVDGALSPLFSLAKARGPGLMILCADHGTAYGEDGYSGHRLAHPVVWDTPYAEVVWGEGSR